ncbi:unnamed protein product [Psylliodes chrysocephalus]|uniref:Uncharacterized protein n=1 Tax=Psylliodes chrysocephalus TaxID=3402493 RepID=A0A9P0G9V1_9CUCU|nr:unnamed protein product [Psylliodes chrysocephala]
MGGSSSATRKLTVENDDPTSVIKVSEEVVDRLRGSNVVRTKEPQYGKPPPDQGGQFPLYWNPSNLTSQQIQHLTANELQKNDQYWQQRIKNLEEKHKKMNQVMEDEYVKAVNEFTAKKIDRKLPPCKETEHAVKECYLEYPREPMRCAKVVQAFQECVDLKRNTLLLSRG